MLDARQFVSALHSLLAEHQLDALQFIAAKDGDTVDAVNITFDSTNPDVQEKFESEILEIAVKLLDAKGEATLANRLWEVIS